MSRMVAAALVHHPILDRGRKVVTTAITNLDLHDIARSARCYDLRAYYVVHPIAAQRALADRVRSHWTGEGGGAKRIPDRRPALERLEIVETLAAAREHLAELSGSDAVELWSTSAQGAKVLLAHQEARGRLAGEGPPVLIVFGTGWGLAPEAVDACQHRLAPIESPAADGYNHLSVRAAAAILFDRLLGR